MKKLSVAAQYVPVLQFDHTTHEFVPVMSAYDGSITEKAWRGINKKFLDDYAAGKFYPLSPEDAYQSAVHEAEKAAAKIADGLQFEKKTAPETYEIGAAKLRLLNHGIRAVTPARNAYRAVESTTIGRGAVGEDGFDIDNHNGAEDCPDKIMSDLSDEPCEESVPAGTPSTAQALADGLRGGTPMHVRAERALNYLSELTERILLTDRKIGNEVVLAFAAYICCDGNIVEASKLARISKNRFYRRFGHWCAWARAASREYRKDTCRTVATGAEMSVPSASSPTGAVTADPLASARRGGRGSTGFCNCLRKEDANG